MKILGIDPSFKATGYGIVETGDHEMKLIETGTIQPKQKDLIQNRLNKIYTILDELIDEHKPDILVLEKIFSHSKYANTAGILGHVRGVICLLCAKKNIELAEHSVKRIRKAVTGNGNATKAQTQKIVAYKFHVNPAQLPLDI